MNRIRAVFSDRFAAIRTQSKLAKLLGQDWQYMRFDPPISIRGSLTRHRDWQRRKKP